MRTNVPPLDRLIIKSFAVPCLIKGLDLSCWVTPAGWSKRDYSYIGTGDRRSTVAHRLAYTELISDVPEGLQLDHLCLNRSCWNPWHLDPVTPSINNARSRVRPSLSLEPIFRKIQGSPEPIFVKVPESEERHDRLNAGARYAFFDHG